MSQRLVECVPNFSEGRDLQKIEQILEAVRAVSGVEILDVDPGAETNRTVVTLVGAPEVIGEAAFQAVKRASQLIDMRERALPILEDAGVDLVLSGHSHSYERTWLIDGHHEASDTFGPVHLVDAGDGREAGDGVYVKPTLGAAPLDRGRELELEGAGGKAFSG